MVLRAAAGSGKTKVLVDRFVRLCLAGCQPKSILAVTFTKKAAVEIKERLLQTVQRFAVMTSAELEEALRELLGCPPTVGQRRRAAQLYAEILEDLPGLPVGTIHAFCQQILGRFAAEAGLDPHFGILERDDELWDEALDRLEREVASNAQARAELATLAATPAGARIQLTALKQDRVHLERWLQRIREQAEGTSAPALPGAGAGAQFRDRAALWPRLVTDLRGTLFRRTVLADQQDPARRHLAEPAAQAVIQLATAGLARIEESEVEVTAGFQKQAATLRARLQEAAARLRAAAAAADPDETEAAVADYLAEVSGLLVTTDGKLRTFQGKRASKNSRQLLFAEVAAPVLEILLLSRQLELLRWNERLLRFGARALDIYDELKRRDGWVDFQDLEGLAWALMRSELGPYVQYRFDQVLEHILVDEFQDTNRNQWEILQPFATEFLAGESARNGGRTLFLVGDLKQSIYAFRGAEPAIFEEVAAWLSRHPDCRTLTLPTNFRSLPALVTTVSRLFQQEPLAGNWPPGEAASAVQGAARDEAPGQVVFLPPFGEAAEDLDGHQRAAQAAVAIARHLAGQGETREDSPPPLSWGDFLVLCRSRTHIATYEQALREANIPIVPAGRGMLARSREVRDILVLLRWLTYPEDDTALASVLRSPIFRLDEIALQRLLARHSEAGVRRKDRGRADSLWSVLRSRAPELDLEEAKALLDDWRNRVGLASGHDLLRHVYRTGHILERFTAALGEQARHNLLRLMDLALSPELGSTPTLRRLVRLVQRAADTAAEEEAIPPAAVGGRVRLMTVHAAKGLEAPVVLLVDADTPAREGGGSVRLRPDDPDGPLFYGVKREHVAGPRLPTGACPLAAGPLAAAAAWSRQEARREETDILYVGMTRARDALFVLGAEVKQKQGRESYWDWLQLATQADTGSPAVPVPYASGPPSWLAPDTPAIAAPADPGGYDAAHAAADPVEPVTVWKPPPQRATIQLYSPSSQEDAASRPVGADALGEFQEASRSTALARGELVHLWLRWAAEAGAMPAFPGTTHDSTKSAILADAYQEAAAVYRNPEFAWIFHPEARGGRGLCEVPFIHRPVGKVAVGKEPEPRVVGFIDRLVMLADRVEIIDYKSDRITESAVEVPRLAEKYRSQLESYRRAIQTLYPEHKVRAHLLFTHIEVASGRGLLHEIHAAHA